MGRTPCCNADGLKKGAWTADEDKKLITYIREHGEGGWRTLPSNAGLQRCGKSCRLRWANYLRPDIKRGQFSSEEEQKIIQLHSTFGNRWSVIARHLPKRTDNEIKNYWNTYIKKRLPKVPGNPVGHKPIDHFPVPFNDNTGHESNDVAISSAVSHSENPRPTSSRPSSSSAQLLNKLATKLALSRPDSLKDSESHQSMSIETISDGIGVKDVTDKEVVTEWATLASPDNRTLTMSRPVSSSVRLLNKMASRLTTSFHCLDTLKSILSKSIEGGEVYGPGSRGSVCDSDPGNSYCMPRSTSTSSLSEVTASELSMSVSNSILVPDDSMAKDLASPDDPFNLEFLKDWQGVLTGITDAGILERCSNGGVSSTSTGDAYNIESPIYMYPQNFTQSNSSTISTYESLSDLLGLCPDTS